MYEIRVASLVKRFHRFIGSRFVYLALILGAYVFIAYLVTDYRHCWQTWDYPEGYYSRIIANGPRLVLDDLRRVFDIGPGGMLWNPARTRYVQNYVLLLDAKFRTWIFNHIIPHPSLSLTWITTLLVAPFFFYRFLKELTGNRNTAAIGLALFLFSSGYLSHLTLFCNPGKPLMTALMCACLYLGARLKNLSENPGLLTNRAIALSLLLTAIVYLSFFTDGEGAFILIALPVMFSGVLVNRRFRPIMIGLSILVPALIAFTILYGAPYLIRIASAGEPRISIIELMRADPDEVPAMRIWEYYNPAFVIVTARNLLSSQLIPYRYPRLILAYFLIVPYLLTRYSVMEEGKRRVLIRALIALALFIVLQSYGIAITLHQDGPILKYPYYYGALLSIFLPIVIAIPLSEEKSRYSALANRVIVCFIALVMAANFFPINREIRNMYGAFSDFGHLERSVAREAFSLRDNPAAIEELRSRYPLRSPWRYIQEIEVTARENLRRDLIRGLR